MAWHLFVASVVDRIGQRPFDRLGNDFLNLLRDNRSVATVLGVSLAGALIGLAAGGVNLLCYQCLFVYVVHVIWRLLTLSGRASSRPLGAASWILPGTADSPCAWDLPWPYSFDEAILTEGRAISVWRKIGRVMV